MVKFLSTVDHGGLLDKNAATPSSSGDLATKGYVDGGFQPLDADLTAFAALAASADGSFLGRSGGAYAMRSAALTKTDLSLDKVLNIKHNTTATTRPTTANNTTQGYSAGSWWFDITHAETYICFFADGTTSTWFQVDTNVTTLAATSPLVMGIVGNGHWGNDYTISIDMTAFEEPGLVGYMPYANAFGGAATATLSATELLAAAGGSRLAPVVLSSSLKLESVSIRNADTATARSWEWRLYREPAGGSGTLAEVAGCNGSEAFTPAGAASIRTAAATSVVTLDPGTYWMCLRNSHASNTFTLSSLTGLSNTQASMGLSTQQSKTVGALGSTLDAATGWAKITTMIMGLRLNGRVFGQSTLF